MCEGAMAEVAQCQLEVCPIPPGPKPCVWGVWLEWGACDKCGGERKRSRQITRMPDAGGSPCETHASEETEKCKRQCHKPIYCEWGKWEEQDKCSVSCGEGIVTRVRYLQISERPTGLISKVEDLNLRMKNQEVFEGKRTREVILSFAAGGLASFVVMMVAMAVLRTRWTEERSGSVRRHEGQDGPLVTGHE